MKYIFFPFSILYGAVVGLRNFLFDIGILKIQNHDLLVISVGNLRVGGSGKTPMAEYLINLLNGKKIALLSRGYGRETRGFKMVNNDSKPEEVGEEILMIKNKYPKLLAAVDENRNRGAKELRKKGAEILILDDAFQHRYIDRNVNLLLSDYRKPFFKDLILPSGRLRESRNGAGRADAVIISNSPPSLTMEQTNAINAKVSRYTKGNTPVFYSTIKELDPRPLFDDVHTLSENLVLLSGIANPINFEKSAAKFGKVIRHFSFPDHKYYKHEDLRPILALAKRSEASILTTEKDAVKLKELEELKDQPIFFLPIEIHFHDFGTNFDSWLRSLIPSNSN